MRSILRTIGPCHLARIHTSTHSRTMPHSTRPRVSRVRAIRRPAPHSPILPSARRSPPRTRMSAQRAVSAPAAPRTRRCIRPHAPPRSQIDFSPRRPPPPKQGIQLPRWSPYRPPSLHPVSHAKLWQRDALTLRQCTPATTARAKACRLSVRAVSTSPTTSHPRILSATSPPRTNLTRPRRRPNPPALAVATKMRTRWAACLRKPPHLPLCGTRKGTIRCPIRLEAHACEIVRGTHGRTCVAYWRCCREPRRLETSGAVERLGCYSHVAVTNVLIINRWSP
mmetsp:Transcript_31393/g.95985  ORF Transcript_31393/g.95985 Transcript_31393/m.95985 type:complete len:281 (+) Transcript_31393:90-932(+)